MPLLAAGYLASLPLMVGVCPAADKVAQVWPWHVRSTLARLAGARVSNADDTLQADAMNASASRWCSMGSGCPADSCCRG